jgi:fructuronate reductase
MADGALARFVERLVREDVIAALEPSPLDLQAYAGEILGRFRNPAIGHRLSQIAWDGSQKLPYRLLDSIADARAAGRPVERLAVPVAAWMLFVERQARAGVEIVDPLAARLAAVGRGGDTVGGLLALRQIFPTKLAGDPLFRNAVEAAVAAMRESGPQAVLETSSV